MRVNGQMKILQQLTCNSAYGTKGKFDRWVSSSLAASMEIVPDATPLRVSVCHDGGMPVTVSSLDLSWVMVQDGVMRRSDCAYSEITRSGTSAMFGVGEDASPG